MKAIVLASLFVFIAAPAAAQTGTLIVLNKSDHTAAFVDIPSLKVHATVPTGIAPHEVAVSPDGKTAVVANYGTGPSPGNSLSVLDVGGAKKIRDIDLGEYRRPHGVAWLLENVVIVTVEANQSVILVDIGSGKIQRSISTGQRVSHMVVPSADRTKAFVANIGSGTCTVLDLEQGTVIVHLETGAGAEGIDIAPNGKEVWVSNREANTVSVLDTESPSVLTTLKSAAFPIRVKFTPDGNHALVSNARSGDVAVFDARKRKEVTRIPMEFSPVLEADKRLFGDQFGTSPVPVGILIEPTGKLGFVANTQADVVTVIDLHSWKVIDRLVTGKEPDGMGFSQIVQAGKKP